jgi:2,4-dienoyl-CoA reductase-like NADH-dependent reductase (Old Yellow Enzyme family)
MTDLPPLFQPLNIRGLTFPNRIVISPMDTYSAVEGMPNDWHFAHYGKFAMGRAGAVIIEATGVSRRGRITNGCLGIYNDEQARGFRRITDFMKTQGVPCGLQIGHGGRKSSSQRPWDGNGPLTQANLDAGEERWEPWGASAVPLTDGWLTPRPMGPDEIAQVRGEFKAAAARAVEAGFDFIEIHMAHGYLLQSFLSPLSNKRNDEYGGDLAGRMRFPLEVVEAMRAAIPEDMPLFARISAEDGIDGGWTLDDSVVLATELKARGVDVVDCSSGGNSPKGATNANLKRGPGYQVPYAERIRHEVGMKTQAVGLIREPDLANSVIADGRADLVAVGRQALVDPFWALHAAQHFDIDPDFERWPHQYTWWLEKWDKGIKASQRKAAE